MRNDEIKKPSDPRRTQVTGLVTLDYSPTLGLMWRNMSQQIMGRRTPSTVNTTDSQSSNIAGLCIKYFLSLYEIFSSQLGKKSLIKSGLGWRHLPTQGSRTEIGLILYFINTELRPGRDTSGLPMVILSERLPRITLLEYYFYHIKQTEEFQLAVGRQIN